MKKHPIGFFTFSILLCSVSASNATPRQADALLSAIDDAAVNIIYDPSDGNIAIDVGATLEAANPPVLFTTFQIESISEWFVPPKPPQFDTDFFDVYDPDKSFRVLMAGFGDQATFGNLGTGRTGESVFQDFLIDGSLEPRGSTDDVRLAVVVVPEPSYGLMAAVFGLYSILRFRRRQ